MNQPPVPADPPPPSDEPTPPPPPPGEETQPLPPGIEEDPESGEITETTEETPETTEETPEETPDETPEPTKEALVEETTPLNRSIVSETNKIGIKFNQVEDYGPLDERAGNFTKLQGILRNKRKSGTGRTPTRASARTVNKDKK